MKRLPMLVVTLLVIVVATAAVAGGLVVAGRDDNPPVRMGPGMMDLGSNRTPGWWDEDNWGSMMMGSAAALGEPEYLAEMVAHHQEAVAAASQLARSDRPQMRAFGESIVTTQSAQIEQMMAWLASWYPEQSTTVEYRPMMRDLSGKSDEQLDRTFLQDMIGHHMAAVMMSQQLLWHGTDHEEVAQLAQAIRDDQHAEISQMQRWLAQWFDAAVRHGMGSVMDGGMRSGSWMGEDMMWGSRP